MRKIVRFATLVTLSALALAAGCGGSRQIDPKADPPVSGRTITGTGISIEFPAGWVEVRGGVTPFTKVYRNKERQLEVRCIETSAKGLAVTTHGDQMKRGLSHDGTVEESGPVTVDGNPAYRAVVRLKTPTGYGVVIGTTILRAGDQLSTLYVASSGDERESHRAEMEALLATVKVL
jgi:hypothetical protein